MFKISFLNSVFLYGLPSLAIPVIIHLLHRKKYKPIDFSFTRFILLSHRKRNKYIQLHKIFLMLLRILVLLLLVLTFTRPILYSRIHLPFTHKRAPFSLVIILDNSYSMDHRIRTESGGTRTLFDAAKDRAVKIIGQLEPGDQAAVLLPSELGRAYHLELTGDFKGLRNKVERAEIFPGKVNNVLALEEAYAFLSTVPLHPKKIYFISDFNRPGFENLSALTTNPEIETYFIKIDEPRQENIGIIEAGYSPETIVTGMPFTLKAKIKNFSATDRFGFPVSLKLNGQTISTRKCELKAGETKELAFPVQVKESGYQELEISLPEDGLSHDNSWYISLNVSRIIYFLSVNGTPAKLPEFNETFFLNLALNPKGYPAPEKGLVIVPVPADPGSLKNHDLSRFDCVGLANVSGLDPPLVKKLHDYVKEGGGLFIALGDRIDVNRYNLEYKDFLPGTIVEPIGDPDNAESVFKLTDIDFTHPVFAPFKSLGNEIFTPPVFFKFFNLKVSDFDREVRILARFNGELPAVLEKRLGKGKIFFFTTACDLDWSDFPHHPVYLPFLHSIVHYIKKDYEPPEKSLISGEIYRRSSLPVSRDTIINLYRPDNEKIRLDVKATSRLFYLEYPDTDRPGNYRVEITDTSSNISSTHIFSVNPWTRESFSEPIDNAELTKIGRLAEPAALDATATFIQEEKLFSRPLLNALLVLLLLFFLAEGIVANYPVKHWK